MKITISIKAGATVGVLLLATAVTQADSKTNYFSGEEIPISSTPGRMYISGGDFYVFGQQFVGQEKLSDKRLAGTGYFNYTIAGNMASGTGPFWGTGRLVPDIGGGEWNGYFVGEVSATGVSIDMTLVGSGNYSGLVARVTYPAWPAITGYVVEAKGGPGDRPFQVNSCSTQRIELLNCVDAATSAEVQVLKGTIVHEVAQATHFGRSSNEGFSLLDPQTAELTGTGTVTAANGDKVRWVLLGTLDPLTGMIQGSVHFCSGTGPFDAVVGGFVNGDERIVPVPGDPLLFNYFYSGSGTIRY